MLLYFRSSDIPYAEAKDMLAFFRKNGYLICSPSPDLLPEVLSALPFSAAVLHFSHMPDGLPHPDALRKIFPTLPLFSVGHLQNSFWRTVPGTDAEFDISDFKSDILARLGRLFASQNEACRSGVFFPQKSGEINLSSRPISLTPAEFALFRVLHKADVPLSAELLSGFIATPGSRHPIASVPIHIHTINEKATNRGLPRPIGARRGRGYTFLSPYDKIPAEERISIIQ